MESIKSQHAELLNALDEMQQSIAYAARRDTLSEAERVIVAQEAQLQAQAAHLEAVEKERDEWHSMASSHLTALVEKQAELNGIEVALKEICTRLNPDSPSQYECICIAQQALAPMANAKKETP